MHSAKNNPKRSSSVASKKYRSSIFLNFNRVFYSPVSLKLFDLNLLSASFNSQVCKFLLFAQGLNGFVIQHADLDTQKLWPIQFREMHILCYFHLSLTLLCDNAYPPLCFFSILSGDDLPYSFPLVCLGMQDWDSQNASQIVTELCGFVTILSGTFLLHKTKDMGNEKTVNAQAFSSPGPNPNSNDG